MQALLARGPAMTRALWARCFRSAPLPNEVERARGCSSSGCGASSSLLLAAFVRAFSKACTGRRWRLDCARASVWTSAAARERVVTAVRGRGREEDPKAEAGG